jgi:hypothetical protein
MVQAAHTVMSCCSMTFGQPQIVSVAINNFNNINGLSFTTKSDGIWRFRYICLNGPQIGHYRFETFEIIPLFDVSIEMVVDPKSVNDWPFSGWDGGDIGHTFLISACQQDKPCK